MELVKWMQYITRSINEIYVKKRINVNELMESLFMYSQNT